MVKQMYLLDFGRVRKSSMTRPPHQILDCDMEPEGSCPIAVVRDLHSLPLSYRIGSTRRLVLAVRVI